MDRLEELFQKQAELNKRVGFDPPGGLQYAGDWLNKYINAMLSELQELRDCSYWKFWYKEAKEGRWNCIKDGEMEHAQVEVIDLLFFWLSLAQCVGLDAKSSFELYIKKLEKNHARQDNDCKDGEHKNFDVKS